MKKRNRLLYALLIAFILLPLAGGRAAPAIQTDSSQERAQELLARLTPEERVGQLFLVSFFGPESGQASPTGKAIYDLVINYHIGGVILSAGNDNFIGSDQTMVILQSLIDQLQRNEYIGSQQAQTNPVTNESFTPSYIPLLIGIAQDGNGYPNDQIFNGLTVLPSQMSIGATWQTDIARQVGLVMGNELVTMGFNLFLGPSLDVLVATSTGIGSGLGVSTFGGDPFWVSEMGKAFITGLHEGSTNRLAVIAKHFPGLGGSDRLPEEEVSTVRKSLEQLKQIELAPFFAVTGNAPDLGSTADGLLTAHIRYQGFQGNIRATTKPVSFDPPAFSVLMNLPAFASWRQNGGLMVSDSLGSQAVRRFYDPTGQVFDGRLVARDAFLAGNDLLYLNNYLSSGDPDIYTSIINTLTFFAQKYREDTAFAQRVDASVLRILTLKYRLYGNSFSLRQTLPSDNASLLVGNSDQISFLTAQRSATLISPSLAELDEALPDPPRRDENIVFLSSSQVYKQCSKCREQFTVDVNALEEAVVRFYSSSGQVLPSNLTSYVFSDLQAMLDAGTGVLDIENDLKAADWLVFMIDSVGQNIPASNALLNFLDQRPDLYQGKRLIVFALNAPYYLDATDVSKITAYYGLYSKSEKFIEVAARLLFQELQPTGELPVSVPGVGYDLNEAMFPDPAQTILLSLDYPGTIPAEENLTPEPTPTPPVFRTGDSINVRTGLILDHNGHPVPDGTIARFFATYNGDLFPSQQSEAQTAGGVARAILRVDRSGLMQIRVEADPAKVSEVLTFDIPLENVTATPPPPTPTGTLLPTPTTTPTLIPTPTITPTPIIPLPPKEDTFFWNWFISLFVAGSVGVASTSIGAHYRKFSWGLRSGFVAISAGLLAYSYIAMDLPGSTRLVEEAGLLGVVMCTLGSAVLGAALTWAWWWVANEITPNQRIEKGERG